MSCHADAVTVCAHVVTHAAPWWGCFGLPAAVIVACLPAFWMRPRD